MTRRIQLCLLLIVLALTSVLAAKGQLQLLSEDSRAKCLDGSSPGFYFSKGIDEDANNFLIFFEGGGRCTGSTLDAVLLDCLERSKTSLGSTKNWRKTYSNDGNFSEDKDINPLFYSWSKVYMGYCDGALYQGSSEPITVNDSVIYFRGYDNVVELFNVLSSQYGLSSAKTVVLTGGSAGALGSLFWTQYLRKFLPESVLLISAPDSGYFPYIDGIEHHNNVGQFLDLITNGKRELLQPEGCEYLYDNENVARCQYLQFAVKLSPVPTFIIESLYDEYSLIEFLGVNCISSTGSLSNCSQEELYKAAWLHNETFQQLSIIQEENPSWGVWAVSCIRHVFSEKYASYEEGIYSVPQRAGQTVSKSLQQFVEGVINGDQSGSFNIDQVEYPNNIPCNGYTSTKTKRAVS